MNTITIKVPKKVIQESQEEITVPIPYYMKDSCHVYKIFSEKECLQVTHGLHVYKNIGIYHVELPFNTGATVATKEEFEENYEKVITFIQSKK